MTRAQTETFQEIGFFGEVKKTQWYSFVQAVQNNISHSRKEKGNIAFNLYQPEDGKLRPIWFERFKNKADHNFHKEQAYFKNAISVIQRSLAGEAKSITLKELEDIPAIIRKKSNQVVNARQIIVLFDVKQDKRTAFIEAMANVAPLCRSAKGNLEFNLYGYEDDPNRFVLIEGWQSQADHELQLKQEYIKKLNSALQGLFVTNPMDARWIVRDISQ